MRRHAAIVIRGASAGGLVGPRLLSVGRLKNVQRFTSPRCRAHSTRGPDIQPDNANYQVEFFGRKPVLGDSYGRLNGLRGLQRGDGSNPWSLSNDLDCTSQRPVHRDEPLLCRPLIEETTCPKTIRRS